MYKKTIENNYIIVIGTGIVGEEITETEYNELRGIIRTAPLAPGGYTYKLRADNLEWELVELPPVPEPVEEDATADDYEAALSRLGVEV